jgi:hypothetical protein
MAIGGVAGVVLTALPQVISLFEAGLPIAQQLIQDAEAEFTNIKTTATITPTQVAADDAALDAADATLQAAKPVGT